MKKSTRSVIRTAYLRFVALFMSMILGACSMSTRNFIGQIQGPYEYWYFAIHADQEALEIINGVFGPGMCRRCIMNIDIECDSIGEVTPPFDSEIFVPVLRQIAHHYPEEAPRDMLVCAAAGISQATPLTLNDVSDRLIEKRVNLERVVEVGDGIVIANATLRPRPELMTRIVGVVVVIAVALAGIALILAIEKAKWEHAWGH